MGDESTRGAPAGLLPRLAALLYDLLLVVALAVVVTFAMLPLTHGEAILTSTQGYVGHLYHTLLAAVVFGYFGWCWTQSGQTLGMKAWRMRLETELGGRVGWAGAAARFLLGAAIALLAILGCWYAGALGLTAAMLLVVPLVANYGAVVLDAERRSLLEFAGRTRVLRLA